MYTISQLFDDRLRRHDKQVLVKAEIDGVEFDNTSIVDFSVENSLVLGQEFEIGTAILSKLTIKLRTTATIAANAKIVPYVALSTAGMTWEQATYHWDEASWPWIGGATEWLPLGEFFVDNRVKVRNMWVFTCYDKLVWADVPYVSALSYPTTMQAVWDEICTSLGYTDDSSAVIDPSYTVPVAPTGYSKRQVMGYIAGANSASLFVGKNGVIRFKRFEAGYTSAYDLRVSDYIRVRQTNPVKTYTRVVVTYDKDDELTYEAGTGDENHTLYVENPLATQAITDALLTSLNGFAYVPITMDARGFPQIDQGDAISFDVNESSSWQETNIAWDDADFPWNGIVTYQTLILNQVIEFRGGLRMSIEAPSKSDQQSEFVVEGTLSQQVNRLTQNAVRQGKTYYGVTITKEDGLKVQRSDGKAEAVFNTDEFSMKVGGVDKLFFDPIEEVFKFTGTIFADAGEIGGWTIEADKLSSAAAGVYPRIDLDAGGNLFKASYDSSSYISIIPLAGTTPNLKFQQGSSAGFIFFESDVLNILTSKEINISGSLGTNINNLSVDSMLPLGTYSQADSAVSTVEGVNFVINEILSKLRAMGIFSY